MPETAAVQSEPGSTTAAEPQTPPAEARSETVADKLFPRYQQNLLNIKVPVSVTLALKKQPLSQILELAPGSIIQFDKSCEEMLDLCVGEHCVARGLAVKVGEKFGLRINQLTGPKERFQSFRPQS